MRAIVQPFGIDKFHLLDPHQPQYRAQIGRDGVGSFSLVNTAALFTLIGLLTVGVELSIMFYADRLYIPQWSMYALFPCFVLAGCLLLLNRKKKVKDELKKRFFV